MPQEYKHNKNQSNKSLFERRGALLYILPAPLILMVLLKLFRFDIAGFAMTSGIAGLFYYAAHLNSKTFKAFARIEKQQSIERVKDHRLTAMALLGGATFLCSKLLVKSPFVASAFLSTIAMGGYFFVYGLKRQKTEIDLNALPKATRKILEEANADIEKIRTLGRALVDTDKELQDAIESVVTQSYKILSLLAKTPEDTGRARRFLSVYLNRIKEILEQYGRLQAHGRDDSFRDKIFDVLTETDKAFKQKASNLLDDDVFKLDVHLDVLRDQINKEG